MHIKQAGASIIRIIPALSTNKDIRLAEIMNIIEPECLRRELNFDNILKHINSIYVFRPDTEQVILGGHSHLNPDYPERLRTDMIKEKLDGSLIDQSSRESHQQQHLEAANKIAPNRIKHQTNRGRWLRRLESTKMTTSTHPLVTAKSSSSDKNTTDDRGPSEEDIDKYIVKLRGQMIHMPNNDLMMFVCSPSVANLNDMINTDLYLSDIPLHDATRDLVLLSEQSKAEHKVQDKLTALTKQLNAMKDELEEEKKKTDRLLYSVLPPTVANEIRNKKPVPAKRFQSVTILFCGIVGFSEFCARNSDSSGAIRIVNLLNKIYTKFDALTEPTQNPHVYKVETVGDKYMVVSGLPEACNSHARHISRLALDIIDMAKTIKLEEYTGGLCPSTLEIAPSIGTTQESSTPEKSGDQQQQRQQNRQPLAGGSTELTRMDQCEHLRVTIGVHCGEVVAGVIGNRISRYCLFGNAVNLASRCETTGKKGAINVSQDVYDLCTNDPKNVDPSFEFEYRGQIDMKGKSEPMGMWLLTKRAL